MTASRSDIARRVTGAAFWAYAGIFSDRALRFVVFLVVARLVRPGEFGIVLLSLLAVEAIQALLNGGLPTALLQEDKVSPALLSTAFLINLFMSALTSLTLLLGAGPIAAMAGMPVAPLLRVLALTPLLTALGSVHVSLIQRRLGFKALALRQAAASLIASVLALALAFSGGGIWALVCRNVVLAAVATVLAWRVAPFRPDLRLDLHAARGALASGMKLWGANIATMVNGRGLDMLAGLMLGAVALGALRIAGQCVMMVIDLTVGPMTALGFALLARAKTDPEQFEQTLVTVARIAALLIFPAFFGLYTVADQLLPLMFGARWAPAAGVVPYMCAIGPALYFQFLISAALFAAGRSDRILQWALIEAVLTVALAFVGGRFGLAGLAAAGTLRLYLMMPLGWRWLRQDTGINANRLMASAAIPLVAAVVMTVAVLAVKAQLAPMLAPLQLVAASIATGIVVYGALTAVTALDLSRALLPARSRRAAADGPLHPVGMVPDATAAVAP